MIREYSNFRKSANIALLCSHSLGRAFFTTQVRQYKRNCYKKYRIKALDWMT